MKEILINYAKRYTDLSDAELERIVDGIPAATYKKGTILLQQGEIPDKCYFVLQGCVRKYALDEDGKETTFDFYTEEQFIAIFNQHAADSSSKYFLSCLEDCFLIVGDLSSEQEMYDNNPALEKLVLKIIEENMGRVQDDFAFFIAATPEERFRALQEKRPALINRVPQYQLASYLGITPESLSRIKRRFGWSRLEAAD